ncbi:MAG: hypothetical protein ACP5UZ_06150 [Thermoplasmata archaeon]
MKTASNATNTDVIFSILLFLLSINNLSIPYAYGFLQMMDVAVDGT